MLSVINFSEVADIYDGYVTVDSDIPFWIREATGVKGKVLELTSGTGRVSIPLLKAGVDLTCVDYCRGMLSVLRQKVETLALTCTVVEADIAELSLPMKYEMIFIPFNSFSEILDGKKQYQCLTRARSHLAARGEFVCTLHNPRIRAAGLDGSECVLGTFQISSGSLVVKYRIAYDSSSRLAHGFQYYEFFDERGRSTDKRSLEVNFLLPGKEEFEDLARSAGFEVAELYGNYDYARFDQSNSPFMIWRLRALHE